MFHVNIYADIYRYTYYMGDISAYLENNWIRIKKKKKNTDKDKFYRDFRPPASVSYQYDL